MGNAATFSKYQEKPTEEGIIGRPFSLIEASTGDEP
jgi:hypothetical protein